MSTGLTAATFSEALRNVLRPGMTLTPGDGVGLLRCLDGGASVGAAVSAVARDVGSVRLVLGWLPTPVDDLHPAAFSEVIALMPGGVCATFSRPVRAVPSDATCRDPRTDG